VSVSRRSTDFVWRLTAVWLSAMGFTVFVGFWVMWLAPAVTTITWSVGTVSNLAMAVACGAGLAWYRRCAPVPLIAFIGALATTLSFDVLALAGSRPLDPFSVYRFASFSVFDILSTVIGFIGMLLLFFLGAPIGLIVTRFRPPTVPYRSQH
jgi:hypothetical protein